MQAFFIIPLTILLTFGGLVFVFVSYFKRKPEDEEMESKFLVLSYFYIVLLISSFLIFWGAALNIKAGMAYGFGVPFSYQGELKYKDRPAVEAVESERTPAPQEPEAIIYEDKIREKSILQGLMFLIFGVIFFIIHYKALFSTLKGRKHKFLSRSYHLLGTLVFGGITLVSVPLSIYTALERILFKTTITPENFYRAQLFPGELLGFAIPAIIIWYLFFKKITKEE